AWQVLSVAVSPGGRTLLAGGGNGSAQFWDLVKRTAPFPVLRHPDAVAASGFSRDGRLAYTASWDRVYLWDAATGEPVGAPLPPEAEAAGTALSPDGRWVLPRSRDAPVRVWQTGPGRPAGRRLIHRGWVTAVAFRPTAGSSFLTGTGGSEA